MMNTKNGRIRSLTVVICICRRTGRIFPQIQLLQIEDFMEKNLRTITSSSLLRKFRWREDIKLIATFVSYFFARKNIKGLRKTSKGGGKSDALIDQIFKVEFKVSKDHTILLNDVIKKSSTTWFRHLHRPRIIYFANSICELQSIQRLSCIYVDHSFMYIKLVHTRAIDFPHHIFKF